MAAGDDIRRETIRIRREQAARNAEALAEKEAALNELAEVAGMTPSERRRYSFRYKTPDVKPVRTGRRMEYVPAGLGAVEFASTAAEKIATEAGLTESSFYGHEPSGRGGYTAADVRAIVAALEEPGAKMDDRGYEDKMDRGGVTIEDKDSTIEDDEEDPWDDDDWEDEEDV